MAGKVRRIMKLRPEKKTVNHEKHFDSESCVNVRE